jgi:C_GCAxxG_C_C family probable redox protein
MGHADRVIRSLDEGLNCAEAMIAAFSETLGMPSEIRRLATPFGGGIGRTGRTCGLVTGAILILGWVGGREDPADLETKLRAYEAVAAFLHQVESACGGTQCPDILGLDLGTEEGQRRALEEGAFETRCRPAARSIVEILTGFVGRFTTEA